MKAENNQISKMETTKRLLNYFKKHGITQTDVGLTINMHRTTVNRRLHGQGSFTVDEAEQIHQRFKVPLKLFFPYP
ncbi:MAG: helix-turn-helix domain-containing protein [Furfurilactobacillus sp.]|nr:helix-turn-helix transcriptional regulator [Furfurilactobacillus sp.]MCH4011265.1 helix-turn-helix domain-containing protein [Furfurilactobacillus sp.]MCH4037157.1 helix-turn-helix domain-containing protein [Furfurilactobacillus sp.]MCH4116205.1 helix-turn-helix domain-containing protein [Furfurilactobacillus sp.]MCH4133133.1 helix-turn-helix domain-containing protein [Furfurilactobacillus sp.]MCI1340361.1 helix-turn-helix domain-containing protein [Furfurilactobacillus sp.]